MRFLPKEPLDQRCYKNTNNARDPREYTIRSELPYEDARMK